MGRKTLQGLKPKQLDFIKAFRSGKFRYMCAAGSTGSGKTLLSLGLLHILCCMIPGVRFVVFRKSEKNLKQTTIPSYNEMKELSFSSGESYVADMRAIYLNGSEILFAWADIAKDPELNNLRGLEVNGVLFEEANQISEKYFHLAKTRAGRWRPHLCPPFILINLNPSLGWVKNLFYDNWVSGTLPEGHYFQEFSSEDNDSLSPEYLRGLKDLPEEEYKRFVLNRWDYSDVPNQLIKYEWYKQCARNIPYITKVGERVIEAVDPAWEGDDDTVLARMHGTHIGWWESFDKQDPDFTGILAHQRAIEHGVKVGDLIVDPIGVGAATALKLRNDLSFEPDMFIAGAVPDNTHGIMQMYNKSSEAGWLLREAMRQEEITFDHCETFQKECMAIRYSIDDKKFRIRPKKEIKKELGYSPGHYDVAKMLIHKYKTTEGGLAKQLFDRQINRQVESHAISRAQADRAKRIRQSRIGE